MQTIHWEIETLLTPAVRRHCKTCGAVRPFVSSGLFRVNANHHLLDIWLIYRCADCGRTWNLTVHERVRPHALDPARLHGFQVNDAAMAEACAHDRALLARAGAVADYAAVPLVIHGPDVDITPDMEADTVALDCAHAIDVRVQRILREKLGLSANALRQHADAGLIRCDGADVRRARFVPGMRVRFGR